MKRKILYFTLLLSIISTLPMRAATCSCAGTQLTNAVNLMSLEPGMLRLGLTYTYIDISELVAGSRSINDETGRVRETESYILQSNYGINENWGLSTTIAWVEHKRNITTSNTLDEISSGIGDSLIVLSYAPTRIGLFSRNEWAVGIGIRVPTGENSNGKPIVFAEDLQPGQGAWGSSLWFHYGRSFSQQADWVFFLDLNIHHNNANDREYSFENEFSLTSGITYSINSKWSSIFSFTYRKASPHTRLNTEIPNTGGKWLDFIPTLEYTLSPDVNISMSARIPLSRDLNGALQFTTKKSFSLSVNYSFQ